MSKQPFVTRNGNVLSFKKGNLSGRVKAVAADEYDAGGIEAVVNELASHLAALKEDNERLKEEFKLSEYSANLANNCREEWKATAIKYSNEVVTLKARVAELEQRLENIFFEDLDEPANEG